MVLLGAAVSYHWRELDSAAGADQSFSTEEEASLLLSKGFVYVTLLIIVSPNHKDFAMGKCKVIKQLKYRPTLFRQTTQPLSN